VRPLARLVAAILTTSILVFGGLPAWASSADGADHSQGDASTQGAYDEAQPLSTADQNSGGANGQCPGGPYCSTRDGSASGNGNGDGKATGKPCAGCVGKADNKNPNGQSPDAASDGNAGYECDGNRGIGQSNPAHTGCPAGTTENQKKSASRQNARTCGQHAAMPASAACAPCADDAAISADADCASPATNAAVSAPGTGIGDSAPAAGAGPAARPAAVLGVEAVRPGAAGDPGEPASAPLARLLPAGLLPNTGAGATLALLFLSGVVLLLAGGSVLTLRRRTRTRGA
jgi:LPXTG-motif cell wall-anchored protein